MGILKAAALDNVTATAPALELESRLRDFRQNYSMEQLSRNLVQRHRDEIKIQKANVAEANINKIITSTLALSNKTGFHAMSMRDLANHAGISMGGLYAYFDNKSTLLNMILGEVSLSANAALSDVSADIRGDGRKHLNWLIETHILLTEVMQPWFVFAYMEAKAFPTEAKRLAVESERATELIFETVVRDGVASGAMSFPRPELAAALIKPILQDWYVKRSKYRKRGVTIEIYIEAATRFISAALGYHIQERS